MLLVDARPVDHPTARQRGIGRHVCGLLGGLLEIGAPVVALYGSDTEAELLEAAVPGLLLRRWSRQVVREHAGPGTWYLATQLMLHPIPLDPIPKVVTEARLPVAALMYDVIPYRYPATYLVDPNARVQAALRAALARTVDVLLANADFVRTTAAEELRFPIERIRTVGVAANREFCASDVSAAARPERVLPDDVDAYVVAVTGGDDRKNTQGLIRAWSQLPSSIRCSHRLVIATGHTPAVLHRWESWAKEVGVLSEVIFAGAVSDDEMVGLLQGARLAVFPSLEEGFGLPIVEAAACGCPTICSGVSSMPEVLDEPAAHFDPTDSASIAEVMRRALTDDARRAVLVDAARRTVQRWTWSRVATDIVTGLKDVGPTWRQQPRVPPIRIALATTNEDLADALSSSGTDLTILLDGSDTSEPTHATVNRWPVRALGRFIKPWDFDHIVAVLGAAPQHLATSQMARAVPCHLWVHDEAMVGVRFGANLQALEIARSAIVGSDAVAELLRRAADRPCPILVVSPDVSPTACAEALRTWLDDVDELDASTIRHAPAPVVSSDS